jgi:hypothetical protein
MLYNAKQLRPAIEDVPLTAPEDEGVKEKWGDHIYRINFEVISPKARDEIRFSISARPVGKSPAGAP